MWDQEVLLEELEKAAGFGTGIVAMVNYEQVRSYIS